MDVLGLSEEVLHGLDAYNTAKEIAQQPRLWQKIWQEVKNQQEAIGDFMEKAIAESDSIILTGAGTSAFIGLSLRGVFSQETDLLSEAISTTDLVSHPKDYLASNRSILLVSFARSGDSPESMAAVELADKYSKNCTHLIVTCNAKGKLAKAETKNGKFVFLLPEEANDKSLAMTSSYTGMLLSAILIAQSQKIDNLKEQVDIVSRYGQQLIAQTDKIKEIAALDFKRAVFLGSGPLAGTAQEAHLKVQELTDGKIICKFDTYLGFRHGPKAVINGETLIMYLFSNQDQVMKYERDLVQAMFKGNKVLAEVGVMENHLGIDLENSISVEHEGVAIQEAMLAVCFILPAQILGFYKSLDLGHAPDNPSVSGAISRVVQGVTIY